LFVNIKIRQFRAAGSAYMMKILSNPVNKKQRFYQYGYEMVITMMKKYFLFF